MAATTSLRKPLGVRATPEQHRLLTEAAAREHRSVNSFVLSAALQAADLQFNPRPKRSLEDIRAILRAAREEVQSHNPTNRNPLAELIVERREAAAHGE